MYLPSSDPDPGFLPTSAFTDNRGHLGAETAWLHQVIRAEILATEQRNGEAGLDEFAGQYISREEVQCYLDGYSTGQAASTPELLRARHEAAHVRNELDRRIDRMMQAGTDLRLERLVRRFALGRDERMALLCCIVAELDSQIMRMFAYLQNDATKRRPTFAQLTRLATGDSVDAARLWKVFGQGSRLVQHCLIEASNENSELPLPLREARLAPGIVDFVLGMDRLPVALAQATLISAPAGMLDVLDYHSYHRTILAELRRCHGASGTLPMAYVSGPPGAGHALIAEALAAGLGRPLLQLPTISTDTEVDAHGRLVAREARLRDAVVFIDAGDIAAAEHEGTAKSLPLDVLLKRLRGCDTIVAGSVPLEEMRQRVGAKLLGFELPYPTVSERIDIWQRSLPDDVAAVLEDDIPALAAKFRFTPGQIDEAVRVAKMSAPRDAEGRPDINSVQLHARCREVAQRGLHQFCQRIVPSYDWDDIVLPADTAAQLQEICRWVKHRGQVYDSWGFGAAMALGKGLTVLLSGASGTGKTMSAEIIAADLRLDLYRVDLSRIVSKYIGETEKNLSKIFAHSATGSCVLFFDEADALFGKRTEVKDAHDRYANIEVNYLLTEIERYDGIIIASTNIKGNLDQAFIRRFSHVVEFPVPNEQLRSVIWRRAFPDGTPLGSDVDFPFLARNFILPGGNIKNIALSAAFLASAEGSGSGWLISSGRPNANTRRSDGSAPNRISVSTTRWSERSISDERWTETAGG